MSDLFSSFLIGHNLVVVQCVALAPLLAGPHRLRAALPALALAAPALAVVSLATAAAVRFGLDPLQLGALRVVIFIAAAHFGSDALLRQLQALRARVAAAGPADWIAPTPPVIERIALFSALLGTQLAVAESSPDLTAIVTASGGAGLSFLLTALVVTAVLERVDRQSLPPSLRGYPIAFIVTGLLAVVLGAIDHTMTAAGGP